MSSTDPVPPAPPETEVKPLFPGFASELTPTSTSFDADSYNTNVLVRTDKKWPTSVPLYTLARHAQVRERTDKGVEILTDIPAVGPIIWEARALSHGQAVFTFEDDIFTSF
ncbi:uncharacterized protein ARMOST_21809 [Armillaria ostoyae]|uniref:Uncharacterized protein n=1 Tax=Armillaria ostoyae TaxID=47428 RepID=A0A284SB47_ARMOS|nr:uncharacterized protein ARMOST_21809 [Armillaria ostoyae]